MPAVSFIIPNYNGKQLLRKYLPALIREVDFSSDEIIVVDDCSTEKKYLRDFF